MSTVIQECEMWVQGFVLKNITQYTTAIRHTAYTVISNKLTCPSSTGMTTSPRAAPPRIKDIWTSANNKSTQPLFLFFFKYNTNCVFKLEHSKYYLVGSLKYISKKLQSAYMLLASTSRLYLCWAIIIFSLSPTCSIHECLGHCNSCGSYATHEQAENYCCKDNWDEACAVWTYHK